MYVEVNRETTLKEGRDVADEKAYYIITICKTFFSNKYKYSECAEVDAVVIGTEYEQTVMRGCFW